MNHITLPDTLMKTLIKPDERTNRIFVIRFHLNGKDFIFQFAVIRKNKIYFHVVAMLIVIISFRTVSLNYLQYAFIKCYFTLQYALFIIKKRLVLLLHNTSRFSY